MDELFTALLAKVWNHYFIHTVFTHPQPLKQGFTTVEDLEYWPNFVVTVIVNEAVVPEVEALHPGVEGVAPDVLGHQFIVAVQTVLPYHPPAGHLMVASV